MTKVAFGVALYAALLGAVSACNGALRFDETTIDARPDRVDAPVTADLGDGKGDLDGGTTGPCAAVDGSSCGWRLAECGPGSDDSCEWHCPSGVVCTSGACGTGCVAECLENSTCAIATGDVSRVECKGGASCAVTLGGGGNAACAAGSDCHVACAGRCAITCQAGAQCELRCGAAATGVMVMGTASCP